MTETKVYGHRGSMGDYPENTLLGFHEAIRQGVDGIELDVHMTKDGEIVVIHDETLDRTTDGTGFIKDLTLNEIKQYSAGGNKYEHFSKFDSASWSVEQVPTLKEVLELLKPYNIELNIELKTYVFNYEGIEEKILSLVESYGNGRKTIYSSFHLPSILRIKELNPAAEIAWLLNQSVPLLQDYLNELQIDALHIEKNLVLTNVHQWKDLYDKIRVWTVNGNDEMKQLLDLKVNTIMTDFPEKALFFKSERKAFV
ncbi:glycerophosphodiester phosphodiesterase [Oceanobacillus rekensis]|uniref:glycerophosphodiester phosphodiesterase n=1 Tax=Oceanobacillus rekensis TaxID=937927 RepID=UPI000B43D69B|nr:glycerophosphodiester phosphodiesterase [Oceanobacillus rekensis]